VEELPAIKDNLTDYCIEITPNTQWTVTYFDITDNQWITKTYTTNPIPTEIITYIGPSSNLTKTENYVILYTQDIKDINDEINTKTVAKKNLNKELYSRYSRFIQEGTWISEEYTNANEYYYDSLGVLNNSSFPQISYSIKVVDIGAIDEYDAYQYEIGDKTYIEDTHYFGYDSITHKPLKMPIIISAYEHHLDDPANNTITV